MIYIVSLLGELPTTRLDKDSDVIQDFQGKSFGFRTVKMLEQLWEQNILKSENIAG
jgi:hypothetical protein